MDTIKHENQVLFVGSYTHQLDTKKRIIFPSSWRNLVGINHQIFAFPHPEQPCLFLYLKDVIVVSCIPGCNISTPFEFISIGNSLKKY